MDMCTDSVSRISPILIGPFFTAAVRSRAIDSLNSTRNCEAGGEKTFYSEPFPKRQILNSSKLKEFADDKFKFDENGIKFSEWIENTVGKGENCSLRAISPFPTVFSKDLFYRHVKTRACLGKG